MSKKNRLEKWQVIIPCHDVNIDNNVAILSLNRKVAIILSMQSQGMTSAVCILFTEMSLKLSDHLNTDDSH